jgi:HAD superfamily hydrolase (TIGR01459 family)
MPPLYAGLHDIIHAYDYFLIDVWGVLYDGKTACPGAPEAMRCLKDNGKTVVLLSNSPKRAARLREKVITPIGVAPDTYKALLTSGESAHIHIRTHHAGRRVYTLMPNEPFTALDGLDITRVKDIGEADVIYGSLVPRGAKIEDYDEVLRRALDRKIPFVCGNPDRIVGYGGELVLCAGSLAETYENMGGPVTWIGKPYRPVYGQAWEMLGKPAKSKILAIGDSIVTDIEGAHNFGCDIVWNVEGIHWEEIQTSGRPDPAKIAAALRGHPAPAGLMHGFKI